MDPTITGKGIEITPAIRSYVETKLGKVERFVQNIIDLNVTLSTEKHLINADFFVKTKNAQFASHGSTTDTFASINEGIDNLTKQIRRANKKIKSHKGRARKELQDIEPITDIAVTEEGEEVSEEKDIHRETMPIKPLSIEEARLQLRSADQGFILFRNATSSEINLLYRRKDGSLALVETNA